MHDVAVNKISLTNPNIDINKWYEGFKEDYSDIYELLDQSLIDKNYAYNKIKEFNILPELSETKIVLEQLKDTSYLDSMN